MRLGSRQDLDPFCSTLSDGGPEKDRSQYYDMLIAKESDCLLCADQPSAFVDWAECENWFLNLGNRRRAVVCNIRNAQA